jgi:DNA-binding transcriptional MerR regulator
MENRQHDEALTRSQVAQRLGVSIATVRRMEGRELHPVRRRDGTRLFRATDVATLAASRAVRPTVGGEIAARACELFREGKGIVDVVIALRQPFEVVKALNQSFLEDQGILLVPGPIVREIEAEFCEGRALTPHDLVRMLRASEQRVIALAYRVGAAEQELNVLERDGAMIVPGNIVRDIERTYPGMLSGPRLRPDDLLRILQTLQSQITRSSSAPVGSQEDSAP